MKRKGVQAVLFHAWSAASVTRLGKVLATSRYRKTVHLGIAPFTGPKGGDLGSLVANMTTLRKHFSGPLAVCLFLSFHNEKFLKEAEATDRAGRIKAQLPAVTGSAKAVSICPMLEDEWGSDTAKVEGMLAAAAAPFLLNGLLVGVKLRRSSNHNSYCPSQLTVPVAGGNPTTLVTQVEFESHGMAPFAGSRYFSNDGNFVCMEAERPGSKKPLPYLEAKDSADNPKDTPNDDAHKFTLAEYLGSRAVQAAPVNLLWRPAYNLYPYTTTESDKVNGRPKARYDMTKPLTERADTKAGRFNDVEAACLARFLG